MRQPVVTKRRLKFEECHHNPSFSKSNKPQLVTSATYFNTHTMVRQGNFMLEVVNANSKVPFQEHSDASKGKTYAPIGPCRLFRMRVGWVFLESGISGIMRFSVGVFFSRQLLFSHKIWEMPCSVLIRSSLVRSSLVMSELVRSVVITHSKWSSGFFWTELVWEYAFQKI